MDAWYGTLKSFSFTLIKESLLNVIKLLRKPNNLKSVTAKEEYFQIQETIKTNEVKTKRLLNQRKFKKFNNIKYKPETKRVNSTNN